MKFHFSKGGRANSKVESLLNFAKAIKSGRVQEAETIINELAAYYVIDSSGSLARSMAQLYNYQGSPDKVSS